MGPNWVLQVRLLAATEGRSSHRHLHLSKMKNRESRREASPRNTAEPMAGMRGEEGANSSPDTAMYLLQHQKEDAVYLTQVQV